MSRGRDPEKTRWRAAVWIAGLLCLLFLFVGLLGLASLQELSGSSSSSCQVNCTGGGGSGGAQVSSASAGIGASGGLLFAFGGAGLFFLLWLVGSLTLLSRRGSLGSRGGELSGPPPSLPPLPRPTPPAGPEGEEDPLSHML